MKLLLVAAGIMLIGYFVYDQLMTQRPDLNNLSTEVVDGRAIPLRSVNSGSKRSIENTQPLPTNKSTENLNLALEMITTYRPGALRARRQVASNMKDMIYDTSNKTFWLYAQSEKDAQWLDQYGYPTPEEHSRISKASDAELENLAQKGDLNAKVHLSARAAKKAYTTLDSKDAAEAHKAQLETLSAGGPYQAVIIAKNFKEMAREFERLPTIEQTQERRAVIARFSEVQETASIMTTLYGDDLGQAAEEAMSNEAKSKYLGLKVKPSVSGDSALITVNALARWRDYNGLPPLVIFPRPRDVDINEKVVIERY